MFDFGLLQPYVDDECITDIDSNSKTVYVTHQHKGEYRVLNLQDNYLSDLLIKLANTDEINDQFNYESPVIDGTIDGLRIHAEHNSFIVSGDTISIRKNPLQLVITDESIHDGYCTRQVFSLLRIVAAAEMSVVFGGEVGTGKTQLMKTFLSYTAPNSAIAFISDIDEMRMTELYPERNYRQAIVNSIVDYRQATVHVLRDNPRYICFQEVRDSAVDVLFLTLSSSSRVTATIHLKKALLMPQRMIQLSDSKNDDHLLTSIHDYVQMCIVPKKDFKNGRMRRYIGEIAMFWNDEHGQPQKKLIYERIGDIVHTYALPEYYKEYFKEQNMELDWSEKIEEIQYEEKK